MPRYDVTVFHEWPDALGEQTFQMAPADADASLEAKTYRRIVRDEMLAGGFQESDGAPLQVDFDFRISSRQVQYTEPSPVIYPYATFGYHGRASGFAFSTPLWWGWPYYDRVRITTVHEHALQLTVSDVRGAAPVRIYEGSVSRRASKPAPVQWLPELMRALLADFPGESGVSRRVAVPPKATGRK